MIIHSTYTQIYPYISLGQSLLLGLSPRIIFGIIAEIILVPLWITSNDWSVKTLKKGDEVSIAGLGIFSVKPRAARMARNPKTGEQVKVPATKVPKFRAAKALKDAVK